MVELMLNAVFVACMVLALAIGLGSGSSRTTKTLFVLLCLCLAVWGPAVEWFLLTNDVTQQVSAAKTFYFVAALFAPILLLFSIYFPREDSRQLRRALPVVAVCAVLMLVWIASAKQFIVMPTDGLIHYHDVRVDQVQYIAFVMYFVVLFIGTLVINGYKYITYRGVQRHQAIWYTIGIAITSVPGFYANLYLPYFGNYQYIWVGPVAVAVFLVMTFYGIVRHSMFDIKLAVVRTLAYVLSLAAIALLYIGLVYSVSTIFLKSTLSSGLGISPVNIVLALMLAFVFQPIKQFFDRVTNTIFYRDRYDSNEFITRLGRVLTSTTELHEILDKASSEIRSTLKTNGSMFVIYREGRTDIEVRQGLKDHFSDDDQQTIRQLAAIFGQHVILASQLERSHLQSERHIYTMFRRRNIALVLPLVADDETVGYLMLGEQQGSGYTRRDIDVLETIADELVIAVQNARSSEAVRDLNTHLEQRIDSATKELRVSNKRLVELDATKDEFVSMASHQLRTPLTSIKGYLSMVLEGDVGDITPEQRQLLHEAFTSSERMVHLIGDFLNVSRLQTGKFIIDRHETDLAQVVRQEVEAIQQIAESHGIAVVYKSPQRFPVLYLDENKLRQVIMNFMDNAIYYSPDTSAPITIKLSTEDGMAVFRVIDKGMGVPAAVQKQLFTKFFRAENARRQRPDGTGIGLFLAKKIIDGHGGKLVFESTEGKGSTFGFRLPIKKLSVPPPDDDQTKTTPK